MQLTSKTDNVSDLICPNGVLSLAGVLPTVFGCGRADGQPADSVSKVVSLIPLVGRHRLVVL